MKDFGQLGDVELLALAQEGDRDAFETLFRKYDKMVQMTARRLLAPDEASVMDVAMTTWGKFVIHADEIREKAAVAGWLRTTARNGAIDLLRKRKAEFAADPQSAAISFEPEPVDFAEVIDDQLLNDEHQRALVVAFKRLPADHQQLLNLLFWGDGLSYADIAAIIDRPIGSIGPSRKRAIEQLRIELLSVLAEDPPGA